MITTAMVLSLGGMFGDLPPQSPMALSASASTTLVLSIDDAEVIARSYSYIGSTLYVVAENLSVEQLSRVRVAPGNRAMVSSSISGIATSPAKDRAYVLKVLQKVHMVALSAVRSENDIQSLLECKNPPRLFGTQLDSGMAFLEVQCGAAAVAHPTIVHRNGRESAPPPVLVRFDPGGGISGESIEALKALLDLMKKHPDADFALLFGDIEGPDAEKTVRERLLAIRNALDLKGKGMPGAYPKETSPDWARDPEVGSVVVVLPQK